MPFPKPKALRGRGSWRQLAPAGARRAPAVPFLQLRLQLPRLLLKRLLHRTAKLPFQLPLQQHPGRSGNGGRSQAEATIAKGAARKRCRRQASAAAPGQPTWSRSRSAVDTTNELRLAARLRAVWMRPLHDSSSTHTQHTACSIDICASAGGSQPGCVLRPSPKTPRGDGQAPPAPRPRPPARNVVHMLPQRRHLCMFQAAEGARGAVAAAPPLQLLQASKRGGCVGECAG